jgi:predicted DNA-binding transcriptional regulator YafY
MASIDAAYLHNTKNKQLMPREKITHERRHIGLRIEILDELLGSNRRRNYSDLLKALNKKLHENGDVPISERTLKYDIAYLIDKKNAPIHRPTPADPLIYYTEKFSLKTVPVDEDDIALLKKAISILKKATDTKLISEVDAIVARLQNKIHTNVEDSYTMIAFEEHTEAKGKEYFDEIFSAIQEKCPIKICYQPFKKEEREWIVHPYMLKEYRNRWFLICRVGSYKSLSNIRLDSIKHKIRNSSEVFIENDLFDPETYFNNVIGVTIPRDEEPIEIRIRADASCADYIRTKPVHKSQKIKKEDSDGSITLEMKLFNNYELKSTLLSYGPGIEVLKPELLKNEMKELYEQGFNVYK